MIKDHADDSEFDAMDIDPVSETSDNTNFVANGAEDSTNKHDSPRSSVRTVMLFPTVLTLLFFLSGRSYMLEMSSKFTL